MFPPLYFDGRGDDQPGLQARLDAGERVEVLDKTIRLDRTLVLHKVNHNFNIVGNTIIGTADPMVRFVKPNEKEFWHIPFSSNFIEPRGVV